MGPARTGVLKIVTALEGSNFVISLDGNGPGVNWERVRQKAEKMGLPSQTQEGLEAALFADGLSTRDITTQTSGRGVGMASQNRPPWLLADASSPLRPRTRHNAALHLPQTSMRGQGADQAAA